MNSRGAPWQAEGLCVTSPRQGSLLIASGADVKTVQARLRHSSAKTTLDTYGHIWPDRDESTKAAVDAVLTAYRTEQRRNNATAIPRRRRSQTV